MTCPDYVPAPHRAAARARPDRGIGLRDCCAAMAIRFATCGEVDPIDRQGPRACRGSTSPTPRPTTTAPRSASTRRRSTRSTTRAREAGLPDGIGANVNERGRWDSDLELALLTGTRRSGSPCFVDYGVLNDREPSKSGDKGSGAAHAISVFGYKSARTRPTTAPSSSRSAIPCATGGDPEIPKGPTWWKMSTLQAAADAYAGGGSGTATWCITPRSKASNPDPSPRPLLDVYASDTRGAAAAGVRS